MYVCLLVYSLSTMQCFVAAIQFVALSRLACHAVFDFHCPDLYPLLYHVNGFSAVQRVSSFQSYISVTYCVNNSKHP